MMMILVMRMIGDKPVPYCLLMSHSIYFNYNLYVLFTL